MADDERTSIWTYLRTHKFVHYSSKKKWQLSNGMQMINVKIVKYSVFVLHLFVQHAGTAWSVHDALPKLDGGGSGIAKKKIGNSKMNDDDDSYKKKYWLDSNSALIENEQMTNDL